MEKKARVVEVKGEIAVVKVIEESGGRCATCAMCKKNACDSPVFEVINAMKLEPGNMVKIKIDDSAILMGTVFSYLFPLAGLIAGAIVAGFIENLYIKALVVLLFLFFAGHYGLKKAEETGKKSRAAIIKKI